MTTAARNTPVYQPYNTVKLATLLSQTDRTVKKQLHCVSKNIPNIFSCNSRKYCQIFTMFGTRVTKKVSNQ